MIPVKTETNYLMDWNNPQDRINYFKNLRKFLTQVNYLTYDPEKSHEDFDETGLRLLELFKKWNVYFIDVDEIPRVNLDEPK